MDYHNLVALVRVMLNYLTFQSSPSGYVYNSSLSPLPLFLPPLPPPPPPLSPSPSLSLPLSLSAAAGYHAARLYRTLKGTDWKKAALLTATLYPFVVFGMPFFFI